MRVIGYTRIRNESIILQETLDHWGKFCDRIYVFDDASTDDSREIAKAHPKVAEVIGDDVWNPSPSQDGRQRGLVFDLLRNKEEITGNDWLCCFDADERVDKFTRQRLEEINGHGSTIDAVQMVLFDFYITPEDEHLKYNGDLVRLRQWCGPEYRRINIFYRWNPTLSYLAKEMRLPTGECNPGQRRAGGRVAMTGAVQAGIIRHYGRAISVAQHQEACRFFAQNFPPPAKWVYEWWGKWPVTRISRFGNPLVKYSEILSGDSEVVPMKYLGTGRHKIG